MHKRSLYMVLLLFLFSGTTAFAKSGFYVGLSGGGNLLSGSENESREGTFNFEFDPGYVGAAALGYNLGEDYPEIGKGRLELEVGYRLNDLDEIEFSDSSTAGDGEISAWTLMLNTWGEYRENAPWIFHLGGGVGAARVELQDVKTAGAALADDNDTVFAWQVGAGVGVQAAPWLEFDLAYRFFYAVNPEFTDAAGTTFDAEYETHSVMAGARVQF